MSTTKIAFFLFFCLFIFNSTTIKSQVITIGTNGTYATLSAASSFVNAGDTLLLESQIFSNGSQFLSNLYGTELSPIVILAETQHQAIFQGGTEAIHLINCEHIEINGLVIEQQSGNGINIDDGGDYNTPTKHITIRNCLFRDMAATGNNDLLKMSGVDTFLIENCSFVNGGNGGSGIDFVGCHWGVIQDCYFDNAGTTGIQNKGGTQYIKIQRNIFKDMGQRALNLGGSTGLQYFRPPLPNPIVNAFEAADLDVFSNIFIGSWSPIAYVGCVRVKVINNTFYKPENWAIRILQETTTSGFLPCSDNEYRNNIIYLENDITEVNVGGNTSPQTFIFTNNVWFNESSSSWTPNLPVVDSNQVIADPFFVDGPIENFHLDPASPAISVGKSITEVTNDYEDNFFNNPPSSGAYEGLDVVLALNDLSYFNVSNINNQYIKLNWHNTDNVDRKGYKIQRLNKNTIWEEIGWVENCQNHYNCISSYNDFTPLDGYNYYRLKSINADGSFEYSKIQNIVFNTQKVEISITPNPANKYISYASEVPFKKYIIYNTLGKTVKSGFARENQNIDISELVKGTYILVVINKLSKGEAIFIKE